MHGITRGKKYLGNIGSIPQNSGRTAIDKPATRNQHGGKKSLDPHSAGQTNSTIEAAIEVPQTASEKR